MVRRCAHRRRRSARHSTSTDRRRNRNFSEFDDRLGGPVQVRRPGAVPRGAAEACRCRGNIIGPASRTAATAGSALSSEPAQTEPSLHSATRRRAMSIWRPRRASSGTEDHRRLLAVAVASKEPSPRREQAHRKPGSFWRAVAGTSLDEARLGACDTAARHRVSTRLTARRRGALGSPGTATGFVQTCLRCKAHCHRKDTD